MQGRLQVQGQLGWAEFAGLEGPGLKGAGPDLNGLEGAGLEGAGQEVDGLEGAILFEGSMKGSHKGF